MKTVILFFALLLLALATAPANATSGTHDYGQGSSSNMYFGLGMGNMKTDIPNVNNSTPSLSSPFSSSLFMGAIFNQNLAAELAYTNLGITDVGNSTDLKGSAYSFDIVGNFPVTQSLAVIAKAGVASTGAYYETGGSPAGTQTLFAPTFGVGIQLNINRGINFRIAYDSFKFTTNNNNTYNANIISLSVLFHL